MDLSEKEKLVVLRICLQTGIFTTAQIEQWAIKNLNISGVIRNDYILDLCSAERLGINEVSSILKQNETDTNKFNIKELLYGIAGYLFRNKTISLVKAGSLINLAAIEINEEITSNDFGYHIEDSIYLATQGMYGTIEQVSIELLSLTNSFQPLAENFINDFLT